MGKSWMIRKDQKGVSPVIATILMVAITVVLAAVLYAMVSAMIPPTPTAEHMIGLSKRDSGNNWSLVVDYASGTFPMSGVTLTLKNSDGAIKYPMAAVPFSELTSGNWNTYKVLYQKSQAKDSYVHAGDSILIDKTTYPSGYFYEASDGTRIVAHGTL